LVESWVVLANVKPNPPEAEAGMDERRRTAAATSE
jgi:hypothetical protein